MGWDEIGQSVERDVDRVLAIVGGLVVLVVAAVVDVLAHRHHVRKP